MQWLVECRLLGDKQVVEKRQEHQGTALGRRTSLDVCQNCRTAKMVKLSEGVLLGDNATLATSRHPTTSALVLQLTPARALSPRHKNPTNKERINNVKRGDYTWL